MRQQRQPSTTHGCIESRSTTLQRGTAAIVYGVTQGEKAPMSAARMAKDQQVVEVVLRDKDPEWFQAQDTRLHSNRKRTRSGQGRVAKRWAQPNVLAQLDG